MFSKNTAVYTRNSNTTKHFRDATGFIIWSYEVVTHYFYFCEDGKSMYSKAVYSSTKPLVTSEQYRKLAEELGYSIEGSKLTTRLFKRNKIL